LKAPAWSGAFFVRVRERRTADLDTIVLARGRLRLLIGLFGVALVGFVMTDDAAGNRADLAVSRQMAGESADDRALDTSLGLGSSGGERQAKNGGSKNRRLHVGAPKTFAASILTVANGSRRFPYVCKPGK
jgi:hypothetical protein